MSHTAARCMPAKYLSCCLPRRFQAVITVRGMESIFRIVETNDFKQLPHITLTFRPGNDAAIKQVGLNRTQPFETTMRACLLLHMLH